ncbi:MAG: orotate phosphoribosyltransferase [Bacteroidota bacterium]|nr:orotate phosphoribosyltransferase [Bacteroidota bacterium]MDP4234761.1 orotate phosphoribosyltransferase [Bacteroidota bacterium]MDP4244152.1 orotate phosphoribosyltransferase [Bacteroidota bacterium]MDP4289314.1 orotate phosphoribosyltransferase [Bacteroidota bacterium]
MTLEQEAIDFFLKENVLKFGDFALKSGRKSPYFFNTGSLCSAAQLAKMGELYARKLQSEPAFADATVIFGSAYKGIPISVATAIALNGTARSSMRAVSDRKEAKTHGDVSAFLGVLNPGDKVVIVDDVMTTGGTKMEAIEKLRAAGAEPVGLIIAFDRAEPVGDSSATATESFEKETGLPVFALANIHDVARVRPEVKAALESYLAQFAAAK